MNSISNSGSSISDALQKLFTDLQASTSATAASSTSSTASTSDASSTDPTSTIESDLQSLFKDVKASGAHGHHHGGQTSDPPPTDDSQSGASDTLSSSSTSDSTTASTTSTSNPFQDIASSLLAYAKTQSLTASTSTSLTA